MTKPTDEIQWDPSHTWELHRYHCSRAQLIVAFEQDGPSAAELLALRRCVPAFRNVPVQELHRRIGKSNHINLGEFPTIDCRTLATSLKEAGLKVEALDRSSTNYLPFDRTLGVAWLIEDEEESKAVATRMLAAGVPVVDAEVD